jgi:hypothetical protein
VPQRVPWARAAIGVALACLAAGGVPAAAQDAGDADAAELHEAFEEYRRRTDERMRALERRLERAEADAAAGARGDAGEDDDLAALRAAAEAEAEDAETGAPAADTAGAGVFTGGGSFAQFQQFLNALNPRITVFGDMLAPIELTGNETEFDDRFSVREIEIDLRAAIDTYASGVLILGVEEEEPGEYIIDAEEAYVTLDTLPWRLRAKIGRFFPAMGNANRLHTHDLPWSIRPYPNQDFLGGGEGWKENGAMLSWLAPPLGSLALTFTGWVLNGENPNVLAGSSSDDPAWMGRAEASFDFDGMNQITLGSTFLFGFNDEEGEQETKLTEVDVLLQHRPNAWLSAVLMGELYYLEKEQAAGTEYAFGAWVGLQAQPGLGYLWSPLQQTYLGVRYDWSDYDSQVEGAEQWSVSTYLSYYTTEFLRFRIGYEHRERASTFYGNPDEDRIYLQVTMVFGSHPAEPFWFNR